MIQFQVEAVPPAKELWSVVAFKESLYTAARSFKFNDLIRDEVALPFVQLDEIKNTIYWYILNYTLLVDGQFKTIDALYFD